MEKYYRICDLNVVMDTYGCTEERARKYECEPFEKEDIKVLSFAEDRHRRNPDVPLEQCEYISTGNYFYIRLLSRNGLMLHSSAVVVDGRAYLFTADSGTGKSTHTELWLKLFGDRAYILNDDKPALRLIDGIWYAYGTPWSGKNDISVNLGVPLGGIAILERGEVNEIKLVAGLEPIHMILKQTVRPGRADFCASMMDSIDKLIKQVPIWKLKCNMDLDAAVVSYEAMSGKKLEERLK